MYGLLAAPGVAHPTHAGGDKRERRFVSFKKDRQCFRKQLTDKADFTQIVPGSTISCTAVITVLPPGSCALRTLTTVNTSKAAAAIFRDRWSPKRVFSAFNSNGRRSEPKSGTEIRSVSVNYLIMRPASHQEQGMNLPGELCPNSLPEAIAIPHKIWYSIRVTGTERRTKNHE